MKDIQLINDDTGRYYVCGDQRLVSVHDVMTRVGYTKPVPEMPHIVEAREKGNQVHKMLEEYIDDRAFLTADDFDSPKTIEFVEGIFEKLSLKPLSTEKRVFNIEYLYAGTMDLLCEGKDELVILDYKHCEKFEESQFVQLELYKMCFDKPVSCYVVNTKLGEFRKSEPRHEAIAKQIADAFKDHKEVELSSEIAESIEIDYMEAERQLKLHRERIESLVAGENTKAKGKYYIVQKNAKGVISVKKKKEK